MKKNKNLPVIIGAIALAVVVVGALTLGNSQQFQGYLSKDMLGATKAPAINNLKVSTGQNLPVVMSFNSGITDLAVSPNPYDVKAGKLTISFKNNGYMPPNGILTYSLYRVDGDNTRLMHKENIPPLHTTTTQSGETLFEVGTGTQTLTWDGLSEFLHDGFYGNNLPTYQGNYMLKLSTPGNENTAGMYKSLNFTISTPYEPQLKLVPDIGTIYKLPFLGKDQYSTMIAAQITAGNVDANLTEFDFVKFATPDLNSCYLMFTNSTTNATEKTVNYVPHSNEMWPDTTFYFNYTIPANQTKKFYVMCKIDPKNNSTTGLELYQINYNNKELIVGLNGNQFMQVDLTKVKSI